MSEVEEPDSNSPGKAEPTPAESPPEPAIRPPADSRPASDRPSRREGRGTGVLAAVALVLALIALAAAGVVAWGGYQLRGEQARVAELEGRVASLQGRVAALSASAASAGEVARLAARLDASEQNRGRQAAALATALQALAARVNGAGDEYRREEAAALMRLAQARLDLARDPAGARRALELADRTLAAAADPALVPVRAALAREIAALAAVSRPDITGTFLRLHTLSDRVDSLPLAAERIAVPPPATTRTPGWSWSGIAAAFQRAFRPLVVVWHGPNARPLLPPREAYFVRGNLKLALAGAELALLERNTSAYHANLEDARRLLGEWFAANSPAVRAAGSTIERAAALNPAPALPRIGEALERMQAPPEASASP